MYVMFLLFYKKCTIVTDFQFRSDCSNSNSDFNSTQSYLLIEHQELLILPFCITSCERVYVSEDAEDDTTSPLLLFTVDENKSPNRPSCPGFFNKIAETFSEAKALIDDEISVLLEHSMEFLHDAQEAIIPSAPLWTMMKMTDIECRIEEVRKYECRKMANFLNTSYHVSCLIHPLHSQSLR